MNKKFGILATVFALAATLALSQTINPENSGNNVTEHQELNLRNSIGSSLFLLGNLAPGDPVFFFQLNYGHQFTPKDNLLIEGITWTYYEPLGTYGNSDEMYPGKVRSYGVGMGYQRFHWKKAFTTVEATPFIQEYYDEDDKEIRKGFQLYLQFILGYQFEFMKKRLFVEPAYALKYWPVNTNMPAVFEAVEEGTPDYIFEPSCNFGYRF